MKPGHTSSATLTVRDHASRLPPQWIAALGALISGVLWGAVALRIKTPLVLADEYVYLVRGIALDRLRRLDAIAPSIPNVGDWVYLRLINLASHAPVDLGVAMRVFNIVCVMGALYILGLLVIAKDTVWRSTALFGLTALLPLGANVAYVMPESLYLLIFVNIFAWIVQAQGAGTYRVWTAAGALIGVLTLVKPHGVFAMLAFLAATLVWSVGFGRPGLGKGVRLGLAALGAFAAALLLGRAGLGPHGAGGDVVGSYYWTMVRNGAAVRSHLRMALPLAAAQAAAVSMLLGPSLAFILRGLTVKRQGDISIGPPVGRFDFVGLFLILLIGVIIASVSFILYLEPTRIQLRYLSFTFPCVLALAWIWGRAEPDLDSRGFRLFAAALWLCGAGYFLHRLPGMRLLAADAPELFFAYQSSEFGRFGLGSFVPYVTMGLICTGALALLHPKVRWFDVQMAVLAVFVLMADVNTIHWQGVWSGSQGRFRAIGHLAKAACGEAPTDVIVLRPPKDPAQVYTALTRLGREVPVIDDHEAGLGTLSLRPGACVLTSLNLTPAMGPPLAQAGSLRLYRSVGAWRPVNVTAFDAGTIPAMRGAGWSGPETGGIWTDGRTATLHIDPGPAVDGSVEIVEINAAAFEPSPGLGQRVEVSANGRLLTTWLVHDGSYEVRLPPATPAETHLELELALPDAKAPASVFPGAADRRLLGISVRRVTVLRQITAGPVAPPRTPPPPLGAPSSRRRPLPDGLAALGL